MDGYIEIKKEEVKNLKKEVFSTLLNAENIGYSKAILFCEKVIRRERNKKIKGYFLRKKNNKKILLKFKKKNVGTYGLPKTLQPFSSNWMKHLRCDAEDLHKMLESVDNNYLIPTNLYSSYTQLKRMVKFEFDEDISIPQDMINLYEEVFGKNKNYD